jgi:hypothetical protein
MKQNLQRNGGFQSLQRQMAAFLIEEGAFQTGHVEIRKPLQSRVRTSAFASWPDVWRLFRAIARDPIGGRNQTDDFFGIKRQGPQLFGLRHAKPARRIVGDPLTVLAPGEESPQMFRVLCARSSPRSRDRRDNDRESGIDLIHIDPAEPFAQMFQGRLITI